MKLRSLASRTVLVIAACAVVATGQKEGHSEGSATADPVVLGPNQGVDYEIRVEMTPSAIDQADHVTLAFGIEAADGGAARMTILAGSAVWADDDLVTSAPFTTELTGPCAALAESGATMTATACVLQIRATVTTDDGAEVGLSASADAVFYGTWDPPAGAAITVTIDAGEPYDVAPDDATDTDTDPV